MTFTVEFFKAYFFRAIQIKSEDMNAISCLLNFPEISFTLKIIIFIMNIFIPGKITRSRNNVYELFIPN